MRPYPGPRPFETGERVLFHGRGFESRELFSLITAHRAVLLYSESGAGKTSLVNAGLLPLLEDGNFRILPSARVRGLIPEELRLDTARNPYVLNTLISWADNNASASALLDVSLTEFLSSDAHCPHDSAPVARVLIFDQFEELFTFYPERWPDRRSFLAQVGEALAKDDLLRAVFVMREEYIGQLDDYAHLLPERLETRFRLERLAEDAARLAIEKPAESAGRRFSAKAAETLVESLLRIRVFTEGSQLIEVPGEFVEPVQLQVVCEQLWRAMPADCEEISVEHLRAFGNVTEALSQFYERSVLEAVRETGIGEGRLRHWFDKTLITAAGTRGTVYRGLEGTGGIPNAAVDILADQHIIRGELRAGAHWYELTHDRFIEPIQESNRRWLARHAEAEQMRKRLEAKTADWIKNGQEACYLLDGSELDDAEAWLAEPDAGELGYSETVAALVRASRSEALRRQGELTQARELARRAEAERAAALRLRRVVGILLVTLILAAMAGFVAWNASQRALNEGQRANAERSVADSIEEIEWAQSLLETDPDLSLLLALHAVRTAPSRAVQLAKSFLGLAIGAARTVAIFPAPSEETPASASTSAQLHDQVQAITFSPDGQKIAMVFRRAGLGDLTTVEIRRRPWRDVVESFSGPPGKVVGIAFSPDSSLLAVASNKGLALLDTSKSRPSVFRPRTGLSAIAFSPDGRTLAAADPKAISLWEVWTTKEHTIPQSGGFYSIAFNPDPSAEQIAGGGPSGRIRLWSLPSGKYSQDLILGTGAVSAIAFSQSSQGTRLAAANADATAWIWDFKSKVAKPLSGHEDLITDIALSKDGTLAVTSSVEGTAMLWSVDTVRRLQTLRGHTGWILHLSLSPDGRDLATVSADNTARLWDLSPREDRATGFNQNALRTSSSDDSRDIRYLLSVGWTRIQRPWTNDECRKYLRNRPDVCVQERLLQSRILQARRHALAFELDAATKLIADAHGAQPFGSEADQRQWLAEFLVEQGKKERAAGRRTEAQRLLESAVRLDSKLRIDVQELMNKEVKEEILSVTAGLAHVYPGQPIPVSLAPQLKPTTTMEDVIRAMNKQ